MKHTLGILSLALISAVSIAAPKTYKIVSDKLEYRNLATVESATEFETFTGKTTKVSGSIIFDSARRTGSGTVSVDLGSVNTGIPTRDDHMRSPTWLDTAKYPLATFKTTKVVGTTGDNYRVTGQFSLHGVTRTITTDARVRFRSESDETKKVGFTGDVAHIYTKFDVTLADYGVKIPEVAKGKVNPKVTITISAYATTA